MPSAIIEAAEAERARLKEEWDTFVAEHEYKLEQLDTIEKAAGALAGDPDPGAIVADTIELTPHVEQSAGHDQTTGKPAGKESTAGLPVGDKLLSVLGLSYPTPMSFKEILIAVRPAEEKIVRKVLLNLIETGEVAKEGKSRATKYTTKVGGPVGADASEAAPLKTKKPAVKPKTYTAAELDAAVMKELREEGAPIGQPSLAMRLKAPPNDVMAALNRLNNRQEIHRVRQPGSIPAWEPIPAPGTHL